MIGVLGKQILGVLTWRNCRAGILWCYALHSWSLRVRVLKITLIRWKIPGYKTRFERYFRNQTIWQAIQKKAWHQAEGSGMEMLAKRALFPQLTPAGAELRGYCYLTWYTTHLSESYVGSIQPREWCTSAVTSASGNVANLTRASEIFRNHNKKAEVSKRFQQENFQLPMIKKHKWGCCWWLSTSHPFHPWSNSLP